MNGSAPLRDRLLSEAALVLARRPSAAVRCRLLRDVLQTGPGHPELVQAAAELAHSKWVQQIAREQRPDGGWGRFHSRDRSGRQRIPTTEFAVQRALALGLEADHPILARAADHIAAILDGNTPFPDPAETNDRWPVGVRLFAAATLTLIRPDYPAVLRERALWVEIATRTFASGAYQADAERAAHAELTGATVSGSYLELNNRYTLTLFGAGPSPLPAPLERALVEWIWNHPGGVRYLNVPLRADPPVTSGPRERWFGTLELLAHLEQSWQTAAAPAIKWLLDAQIDDGAWDFGSRAATSPFLPLSDDWRRHGNRCDDWTVRTLLLLNSGDDVIAGRA